GPQAPRLVHARPVRVTPSSPIHCRALVGALRAPATTAPVRGSLSTTPWNSARVPRSGEVTVTSAVTETPSSSSGTCAETRVVGSATRTVRSSPSPSGRSAAPQCSGERSTGTSPEGALTAPGTTSRAPSTTSTITSSLAAQPASSPPRPGPSIPPPLSRSRNCPSGGDGRGRRPVTGQLDPFAHHDRRDWGAVHAELALEPGSRGAPVLRVGGYEHSHRGEAAVAVALGEMEGPGDLQDAAVGPDR